MEERYCCGLVGWRAQYLARKSSAKCTKCVLPHFLLIYGLMLVKVEIFEENCCRIDAGGFEERGQRGRRGGAEGGDDRWGVEKRRIVEETTPLFIVNVSLSSCIGLNTWFRLSFLSLSLLFDISPTSLELQSTLSNPRRPLQHLLLVLAVFAGGEEELRAARVSLRTIEK